MFYLNFNWFMQTLLDRKDRMSMAHGLEVRVPYCDYRLVQYVWNIPWDLKMLNGREKAFCGKRWREFCRMTSSTGKRARTPKRTTLPTRKPSKAG